MRRLLPLLLAIPAASTAATTEFCLEGEFDIGYRLQGMSPDSSEPVPTSWCLITEDRSARVLYSATGKANPDMANSWSVSYLPPDTVRIVNRSAPPDIEFQGTDNADEARRVRRIDPRRLLEELDARRGGIEGLDAAISHSADGGERLLGVSTTADLPLRGRVPVEWNWDWADPERPTLELVVDGRTVFTATGRWRSLSPQEAEATWIVTPGADKIEVPGDRWPARVSMQLINLTDDVYLVRGVRTGFQHLVVDTPDGLIVADAPAGWVEFHQLPPADLVPGLGISGLSEIFIDFLEQEFDDRRIRAVALTHFHDDHAGGARAFSAAGANIYVPAEHSAFLAAALNRKDMPADRKANIGGLSKITSVDGTLEVGAAPNRVRFVPLGPNPHVGAMLGVWAVDQNYFFVSDVHVPRDESPTPRAERAATECWFALWASENLPADVNVVNSHSAVVTPVSRLAEFLESESCSSVLSR